MKLEDLQAIIREKQIEYIDLRLTDLIGTEHHVTSPISTINGDLFEDGKAIDGSSFQGWQDINESDLILMPEAENAFVDPFYHHNTLVMRCNIVDPITNQAYIKDPRRVAIRAEEYAKNSGIADAIYFGPEPEFFVFDDVRFQISMNLVSYSIDSTEGAWNANISIDGGNIGHRPAIKGGYFPLPPVDSSQDLRSSIAKALEDIGIVVEAHHHEVATANQCEIATKFNTLTKKADELQILKYVVRNMAHQYGKTATFMPKPLVGDNGSGMHCHQSLAKNGQNLFAGNSYEGLSETALYYIGGIMKHAHAINAFTNPGVNSYKRLVPGFEAPVFLAYSARNRSAAIRIPSIKNVNARRIEVRFPDPTANPYLAFAAMAMAGMDGIKNKIHPGDPVDKDLYQISSHESLNIKTVATSLEEALLALEKDNEFLLVGDVFNRSLLENYIKIKRAEAHRLRALVHPAEFELYYSS